MAKEKHRMKNIITIGRELGSGGRTIGKKVAELLGYDYYDRELIDEAAKESGLSSEFIEKTEQSLTGSFLYNLAMGNSYSYGMLSPSGSNVLPLTMQVFLAQQQAILKFAEKPCVIVGRCADYVLRDRDDVLKVFVYSTEEKRIERAVNEYGLDPKEARSQIIRSDKSRARHYATFTDWDWAYKSHYDLMINSGVMGIDMAADLIAEIAKK